jgi:uncharacterized protein (DUF697 family)
MPGWDTVASVWKNLQELDLRPLREAAERDVRLAIVGETGAGKHTLATQMRNDPTHPGVATQTPILQVGLDTASDAADAELIVVVVGPAADSTTTAENAASLVRGWRAAGKRCLVLLNRLEGAADAPHGASEARLAAAQQLNWGGARVLTGSVHDRAFLENQYAPAVVEQLADRKLALGRGFPLFRQSIAQGLINEACLANASYSFGTGLAEVAPVLDLPLNLADMVVLTKGQALLVYKLGLALGLPRDWQYYLSEFGGVIGGGFLWRQLARSLVGLIPGWGILPKVAIAYAGTYVVGQVVFQWYLTGRHITRAQMNALYRQALDQGRAVATALVAKTPRPQVRVPRLSWPKLHLPGRTRRAAPAEIPIPLAGPVCPQCGTRNDPDAQFCKHCGHVLPTPPLGPE